MNWLILGLLQNPGQKPLKRLGALFIMALSLAGVAAAPDLPPDLEGFSAAPTDSAYDWSGVHIGGVAGYGWGQRQHKQSER